MATANVQLSEISKPLRNKIRSMFRGKAPIIRQDLPVTSALYYAPRSTVQVQLAYCAPERWPEVIDPARPDAGALLTHQ